MSFSQHLVLWLHVAFVIFTIGPVTLAIMSTPRYIRKRDIRILRYLARMTLAFGIGSVGVLVVGVVLASMLGKGAKPWIIISETLFVVTVLLLGLIHRDQRHAIKSLETAAASAASATAAAGVAAGLAGSGAAGLPSEPVAQAPPAAGQETSAQETSTQATSAQATSAQATSAQATSAQATQTEHAQADDPGQVPVVDTPPGGATDAAAIPAHMANVERGRIAMMGGVVTLIWLVVLVLMVWNG